MTWLARMGDFEEVFKMIEPFAQQVAELEAMWAQGSRWRQLAG